MKAFIYPNLNKANSREYVVKACSILSKQSCEVLLSNEYCDIFGNSISAVYLQEENCFSECDVVVAVGGDGTILKCAQMCSKHGKPIVGINCGRLGFMASLEHSQIDDLVKLVSGEYTLSKRMLLSCVITDSDKEKFEYTALNDVVISKTDGCKIADFEVSRNGHIISSLRADGIIFSTPTGASAYSMSAGGPIIEPGMNCIEFTQICPHSLFARTMIFDTDSILTAKCFTGGAYMTNVTVDGNMIYKMSQGDIITISKSDKYVEIIDINGDSFFESVNKKLMQPLKDISTSG
ncbi:NAD(+)/NADH kinase [Ruminococcus sp. FC2018]|uniref:NAD(+)/NADH kinase n=1 Tax=Ruminococcus sp. FC2018 TaxID=1410617 RepID=UPI0004914198|nr:NAD(+)/NADH kinase [Ruminococcus sp. FC2018]